MIKLTMLGTSLTLLFHCISYFILTKQKYGFRKSIYTWIGVCFTSLLAILILLVSPIDVSAVASMGFLITLAIFAITFFVLSGDAFPKAMFLFTAYSIFFVIVQFISGYSAFLLFDGAQLALFGIRSLVYIAALPYYYFYVKKHFETISANITEGWLPLNVVSILIFFYISYIVYGKYNSYDQSSVSLFFLMTGIIVAVFYVIFNTIGYMHQAAVKEQVQMQSDFLMRQVEAMQNAVDDARRSRHDIRHHNLLIAEYAKNGEIEALLKYLNAYEQEAEQHQILRVCQHLTVNNILLAYAGKAQQNQIEMKLDVNVPSDIGIKDTDIVAILANMLENCILGCIRSGEAKQQIAVYIAKKENKLVIQARNTCASDITFENGLPRAKNTGGIGMSSMLHSASRYSGEVDFRCENNTFTSRVLLNIPQPLAEQ